MLHPTVHLLFLVPNPPYCLARPSLAGLLIICSVCSRSPQHSFAVCNAAALSSSLCSHEPCKLHSRKACKSKSIHCAWDHRGMDLGRALHTLLAFSKLRSTDPVSLRNPTTTTKPMCLLGSGVGPLTADISVVVENRDAMLCTNHSVVCNLIYCCQRACVFVLGDSREFQSPLAS